LEPPFPNIGIGRFITMVINGQRPPRPEGIDFIPEIPLDDLWQLVEACWSQLPDRRPTASGIEKVILQLRRGSGNDLVTNDGQSSPASETQMASRRKHTCRECDQAFSSMSILNDHIKVHHEKICECFMAAVFKRNSMKVSIHMPRYWL
jgi:hypothetical protein